MGEDDLSKGPAGVEPTRPETESTQSKLDPSGLAGPAEPQVDKPFSEYMKSSSPQPEAREEPTSPFDLMGGQGKSSVPPSSETVLSQIKDASAQLEEVKGQLEGIKPNFRPQQRHLLDQRLKNLIFHIKSAARKLQATLVPSREGTRRASPVRQFLGLITDGLQQLKHVEQQIGSMQSDGRPLSPTTLLLLQVKLAKAQQEIEYFSVLFSKGIESIKQMSNIQI